MPEKPNFIKIMTTSNYKQCYILHCQYFVYVVYGHNGSRFDINLPTMPCCLLPYSMVTVRENKNKIKELELSLNVSCACS